MTVRKATTYAMALPPGSVTWQLAGVDAAWTTTDHLLASAVDALNGANWQRSEGTESTRPTPVPRPTEQRQDQDRQDRIRAKALEWRNRHHPPRTSTPKRGVTRD